MFLGPRVELWGQLAEVGFPLLSCGSQGLNLGHQAWQHGTLLAEPSIRYKIVTKHHQQTIEINKRNSFLSVIRNKRDTKLSALLGNLHLSSSLV